MAVSAVVTPGKIFTDGEAVVISELNKLGTPTVDISGAVGTLSLSDGSVTNAKVAAGTGLQLDKLETGTDAQVIVGNTSGEGVWKTISGDATLDNTGALTLATGAVMPVGAIIQYGGTSSPSGWLFCDGTTKDSVADTSLGSLFTAIGTTYGGTGSDDFNLPDLRGRVPMGTNDAGLPNGLLTSDTARPTERNEGDDGGTETHTLLTAEMPAHTHQYFGGETTRSSGDGTYQHPITTNVDTASGSTGGDGAHANTQPFVVVNFIIKV